MDHVCPDTLSDFRETREIGIKTGLSGHYPGGLIAQFTDSIINNRTKHQSSQSWPRPSLPKWISVLVLGSLGTG